MKKLIFPLLLILLALAVGACNSSSLPELPTPVVPSLADIDAARLQWRSAHLDSYFIEVDETTHNIHRKLRIVVVDGEVRNAQEMIFEGGQFGAPVPFDPTEAQAYTVDAIFDRIRTDALTQGDAPVNLDVIFEPTDGYPSVVKAEASPTYNERNELSLNRDYSYNLAVTVDALLEDLFGISKDPLLTYTRLGGENAWCDVLRIYPDRSSIYTNECDRLLLQLNPPITMMDELNTLAAGFEGLDILAAQDLQSEHLVVVGAGSGSADAAAQDNALALAAELMDLLSRPVGEGLTLIFTSFNQIFGLDMRSLISQPASVDISGVLYSAAISPGGGVLYFSDQAGLHTINMTNGETGEIMSAPENSYYRLHLVTNDGYIVLSRIPLEGEGPSTLGWLSDRSRVFHDLPLPDGVAEYGCPTGFSSDPTSGLLAVGGRGFGAACNTNPGLTIVDLKNESATLILDEKISSGSEDVGELTAGVLAPAWAPDGSWLAFGLDRDAVEPLVFPSQLHIMRPDGSGLQALTDNTTGSASFPAWGSPKDLYYSLTGVSEELDGIYHYSFDTGQHTLIIKGSGLQLHSIAPTNDYLTFVEPDGDLKAFILSFSEIIPIGGEDPVFLSEIIGWLLAE